MFVGPKTITIAIISNDQSVIAATRNGHDVELAQRFDKFWLCVVGTVPVSKLSKLTRTKRIYLRSCRQYRCVFIPSRTRDDFRRSVRYPVHPTRHVVYTICTAFSLSATSIAIRSPCQAYVRNRD